MTVGDIKTRIRVYLKEPAAIFWTEDELIAWINEVQVEILLAIDNLALTKFQQEAWITADGVSPAYSLPEDYLMGFNLEDGAGKSYKLLPINNYLKKEEILSYKENYIFTVWNDAIYVSAAGAVVLEGTKLNFFYIRKPAVLINDADVTELPSEFIPALIYGVVVKAYLKEGNSEVKNFNDMFVNAVTNINARYKTKGK